MKRILILVLYVVVGLTGCNQKSQEDNTEVKYVGIDWNALIKNKYSLSDFVVSYKYVPLETKPECLMGWIDKIVVRDNTMYILESSGPGRLFMFTGEGKYLRKLDRFGKGPGEYIGIRDFEISADNSKIYLLTESDNILIFNSDCSYDKTIIIHDLPEPVSLFDFLIINDAFVFNITSRSTESFLTTDLHGKFISYGQKVPGLAYVSDQLSNGLPNSTYVKRICDTIFKINQYGRLAPYLRLDFGENALTIDEWNKASSTKNGWSKEIPHPYARFNQFYALKDLYILQFAFRSDDQEEGYLLIGSTDGESVYCGTQSAFNDYLDHTMRVPLATSPENNTICTSVYPFLIHEALIKYHQKGNRKSHVIDSLCNITKEDDNPIIAFYKLRNVQ